ncbi:MAG TPA: FeoA family protein [Flavisolibacter sp.]|nr:FeoA family protein [Flavisolibacter sp.]
MKIFKRTKVHLLVNLDVMKRLSEIKQGKTVTIVSFENNELLLKLMEMGCIPGEEISVEQIAPLGGPMSIRVAGYSLSLRIAEAAQIMVEDN